MNINQGGKQMIWKESPVGQRVFVYYNLRSHLWSVKALTGPNRGLVIAHCTDLQLSSVTPRVSEAGRQRVLRDKQKNVHAGLVGHWVPLAGPYVHTASITYNPYRSATFTYKGDGEAYSGSARAWLIGRDVRVGKI